MTLALALLGLILRPLITLALSTAGGGARSLPALRILPSFGNRKVTLPASRVELTVLTPGQQQTLDTVLAEAVVTGERAIVGFIVNDGSDVSNQWKQARSFGAGERIRTEGRTSVEVAERINTSKDGHKGVIPASYSNSENLPKIDGEYALDESKEDDVLQKNLAKRVEQLRREEPIRSISSTTFCCIASVTGLTRSPSTGRVIGASLVSFQRALVSRVEVLPGGALLAQPSDWHFILDEPDQNMSPVHYLNAVHSIANQCRVEHDRCVALMRNLDELWESGVLVIAMRAFERQQDDLQVAEDEAIEKQSIRKKSKDSVADTIIVLEDASLTELQLQMKSMEEAGRRGSAGEVLRQRQAEEAEFLKLMEEKEDPWTDYLRGDFSLGLPTYDYELDDDKRDVGDKLESSRQSVHLSIDAGHPNESRSSIHQQNTIIATFGRQRRLEILRHATTLNTEVKRLEARAKAAANMDETAGASDDINENNVGLSDDYGAAEPLWSLPISETTLVEATDLVIKERRGWCDDWIGSMENSRRTKGNGDNENHEASNKSSIYDDNVSNIDLRATAVRGKPIDDNELEWYQAFSFVAWRAGTILGNEGVDIGECLHCTSTLQRLKAARGRLSKRREILNGWMEIAGLFGCSSNKQQGAS